MNYTTRKSSGNQSFPPSQVERTFPRVKVLNKPFQNNLVYKILALILRKDQASPLKPVSQDQCQPVAGKAQMHQSRILLECSPEAIT